MKKVIIIYLLLSLFWFTSCLPDYSYSNVDTSGEETKLTRDDLLEKNFNSDYYNSLGEDGLKKLSLDSPIIGLNGKYGTLLYANTPRRMIFNYSIDKDIWALVEYDKILGCFSFACHDVLCPHDTCLFSGEYKIFNGENHLFFISLIEDGDYFMSDLDGNNIKKISIPKDAELYSENLNGLYWGKTELVDEKVLYSIWFYDYTTCKSKQLLEPSENVIYYVVNNTIYMQDLESLSLYRISSDYCQKTLLSNDVVSLLNFNGVLYDYDFNTGDFRKLEGEKMVKVATIPSIIDYWVSDGYIYFCMDDRTQIESKKDDEKIYEYLTNYNQTCGNIYRIKEFENNWELVYCSSHDDIPDLIDNIFADGEVVYIQYRDYKNFDNNYSNNRGVKSLVILDVTSGKSIDISNSITK